MVSEEKGGKQAHAWAGPALFITVSVLLAMFFFWFVRA